MYLVIHELRQPINCNDSQKGRSKLFNSVKKNIEVVFFHCPTLWKLFRNPFYKTLSDHCMFFCFEKFMSFNK
jgi:hypothetical protein